LKKSTERSIQGFIDSDYFIGAAGIRNVGLDELKSVLMILIQGVDVKERLQHLYRHHPDTIELDKYQAQSNCPNYNQECDCYIPGVNEIWCRRNRKRRQNRNTEDYKQWRADVFERDRYTCQECGQKGGVLNAHHIKSFKDYPDLRTEITNGVTYCERCHRDVHRNSHK
jgi:hypothetical protein